VGELSRAPPAKRAVPASCCTGQVVASEAQCLFPFLPDVSYDLTYSLPSTGHSSGAGAPARQKKGCLTPPRRALLAVIIRALAALPTVAWRPAANAVLPRFALVV
jgi:hypothetical protein